jgi:hypothetical protein
MTAIIVSGIDAVKPPEPTVLRWSRTEPNISTNPDLEFAAALNALTRQAGRAGIAVLADDVAAEPGWLLTLVAAAEADDIHAGAGPVWTVPADPGGGAERALHDSPLHPRAWILSPDCCYLRRTALDLVGDFIAHSTPEMVLTDWCARAVRAGLSFVLADELPVLAASTVPDDPLDHELGPLHRVLMRQRRASRASTITIDARALGPRSGGTQSYTAALVLAVAATHQFALRAVVAHDAPPEATTAFAEAGVEVISYEQAVAGVPLSDLLHRPQQIFGAGDLNLGRLLSERLVITHLDLIAFHNPSYHDSDAAWREHRRMTRIGMTAADTVVFTSAHALNDALAEELVDAQRTAIAGIGVQPPATASPAARPAQLSVDRPFLLVLGADYAHKNRPFAIQLFRALREQHRFGGRLILAGKHMEYGSSAAEEQALLASDPDLAAAVIDLGPVSEAEKHWLLANAAALICPSIQEGYGLTPLEAAGAGVPCIFAAVTALADVLDPQAGTITPWDAQISAGPAAALLDSGPARDQHVKRMRAALERASWSTAADQLGAAYERALSGPYRPAAQVAWEQLEREQLIADLNRHQQELEGMVGNALSLAGRGGLLSAEQQLGLIRVASRPRLARPLLAPFRMLGRLGGSR